MQYYYVNTNGRVITEDDLRVINDIYGDNGVENLLKMGHIKKIDPPSVVDCLLGNNKHLAIKRYREIHEVKALSDALDMVKLMEKDIRRFKKHSAK